MFLSFQVNEDNLLKNLMTTGQMRHLKGKEYKVPFPFNGKENYLLLAMPIYYRDEGHQRNSIETYSLCAKSLTVGKKLPLC